MDLSAWRCLSSGLALSSLAVLAAPLAQAQQAAAPFNEVAEALPPNGPVEFRSVLKLGQVPTGASPQLRHAEIANSGEWPASLFAEFDTDRGQAVCTAALVGPQAMLTAAHCVPASGEVRFQFGNAMFHTDCEQHPSYKGGSDASADFALCRIVRKQPTDPDRVDLGPGNRFERINLDPMNGWLSPPSSQKVWIVLTGYGCISDIAKEAQIDGFYRTGRSFFVENSNSPAKTRGPDLYAPKQVNNYITVDDVDYANVCPGDSGGPAFGQAQGKRVIIGVNSRVFYRDAARKTYGASLISATGGPSFASWATGWAARAPAVQICGIRNGPGACQ